MEDRSVFIISDGTGITAGALGKLLEHFPNTSFTQIRLPFVDDMEKVLSAKASIQMASSRNGIHRPIAVSYTHLHGAQ